MGQLGWRLDDDVDPLDGLRIVQFTPLGSGTSITFGGGLTTAAPGAAAGALIASDIEAARDELGGRGIEVSDIWHGPPFPVEARQPGPDPDRASLRVHRGSGGCASACADRAPRAREAQRGAAPAAPDAPRRGLVRLVRPLHGVRAGRDRSACVTDIHLGRGRRGWRPVRGPEQRVGVRPDHARCAELHESDSQVIGVRSLTRLRCRSRSCLQDKRTARGDSRSGTRRREGAPGRDLSRYWRFLLRGRLQRAE
jgi:hypothetical protein